MRPSIASTLIAVLLFGACGDESDASHHGGKPIDDWPSGAVLLLEDHQDTVVAEVDAHGRPVSQTAYHPYGGVRGQIGAGGWIRYEHAAHCRKRSLPSAPDVQKKPLGWSSDGSTRKIASVM